MDGQCVERLTAGNWHDVVTSDAPVLVDFGAEWCGPCQALAPVIAEIAYEFAGQLRVGTVDVDAEPELAAQYGVMGLPTLLIFKGGKPVSRLVGFKPIGTIRNAAEAVL
ncbi:MAG: thioredoxin [Candidatus Sericytochromatia bacterium]|uniref:Thioredoxin n=1 Tax=Candidatus Tanganyikabacteria bacterium TaxID=2961651 RepID=A0A937X0R6_9BACT|nr:thioredoxin [Candidatus Tanganyikabacteria bacterium]